MAGHPSWTTECNLSAMYQRSILVQAFPTFFRFPQHYPWTKATLYAPPSPPPPLPQHISMRSRGIYHAPPAPPLPDEPATMVSK